MDIVELTERFDSIGVKITKIVNALISSLDCEEDEGDEITLTEFEMIDKLESISESFKDVIDNYMIIKQQHADGEFDDLEDEDIQRFNNGFILACDMIDFFMTKLARKLEIGV